MSQVMIVEDDKDLLNLYRIVLSKKGREIVTVSDSADAINLLQNPMFTPNVIIVDINISAGMSGLGLLNIIRQDPRLYCVPVMVVTANDMYRDPALKAGARAFLVKPVKITDIAELANKFGA
jgi:two-component system, OmpR family, response regulator